MMTPAGVMHLIDTLDAGGAERVAVNLANLLPSDKYRAYLCTTRRDGALAELVADHVGRMCLARRRAIDLGAIRTLNALVKRHNIAILHAHGTSLFFAALTALLPPRPAVIWHDHFGRQDVEERPLWLYRPAVRRVQGVIAVSRALADWSRQRLGVPADRVWYIPNFASMPAGDGVAEGLPGVPGSRIVCVANFRPQKDHITLVRAMTAVVDRCPDAHLLLVGEPVDRACEAGVREEVRRLELEPHVTFLGSRRDVPAILRACDAGVLSSASEGLPLALIEYGTAGLPVVATRVGECADVLDEGRAGIVVPPDAAADLAAGLIDFLGSPDRRTLFGQALRQKVRLHFDADVSVGCVCEVYERVLKPSTRVADRAA